MEEFVKRLKSKEYENKYYGVIGFDDDPKAKGHSRGPACSLHIECRVSSGAGPVASVEPTDSAYSWPLLRRPLTQFCLENIEHGRHISFLNDMILGIFWMCATYSFAVWERFAQQARTILEQQHCYYWLICPLSKQFKDKGVEYICIYTCIYFNLNLFSLSLSRSLFLHTNTKLYLAISVSYIPQSNGTGQILRKGFRM
jgi:hypothetical protein